MAVIGHRWEVFGVEGFTVKRFGFLSLFFLASALAAAGVRADGLMNAVSYQPLPSGAAIFVRPMDNSDQNLTLQKDFEHALKRKGYTISETADLILTFETRDAAGAWTGGGPNPFIELSDNHDQTGVNAPRVRFNLFNSSRGGLLNPDRTETTRMVTPSRFRIDATIDDKTNGKRLWQGWSTTDIGAGGAGNLTRAMVPVLVDVVGQTVRRKSFPLQ